MKLPFYFLLSTLLLLCACLPELTGSDASSTPDAGFTVDADFTVDAGVMSQPDAATDMTPDASTAVTLPDATVSDATVFDSGCTDLDGGMMDSGVDAGTVTSTTPAYDTTCAPYGGTYQVHLVDSSRGCGQMTNSIITDESLNVSPILTAQSESDFVVAILPQLMFGYDTTCTLGPLSFVRGPYTFATLPGDLCTTVSTVTCAGPAGAYTSRFFMTTSLTGFSVRMTYDSDEEDCSQSEILTTTSFIQGD